MLCHLLYLLFLFCSYQGLIIIVITVRHDIFHSRLDRPGRIYPSSNAHDGNGSRLHSAWFRSIFVLREDLPQMDAEL